MKIKDIDFPEPLIDAQRKGTLVVFAGAGVSRGHRSNLPGFQELAERVADRVFELKRGEPVDHFLGQLEGGGVDVHTRAQEILASPTSKPNPLHRALLSLFPSPDKVRLITTNFDQHFTTAAKEVFAEDTSIFYAPALPLGNDFNGIVYLHGCIVQQPKNLVLTDCDFGRAYLTEGWATRFLQAMFDTYAVLFIGYSHNDTVMNYLSRALPRGSGERYALTESGREERWRFLGITPLPYQKAKGRYPHSSILRSIETWSKRVRWGALEHERRIKEIVQSPPPLDPEEIDYLKNALRDLENVRFFTRYARTPDWLRWADDNLQSFRDLFGSGNLENAMAQILAIWFTQNFVWEHVDEALAVIQRHKQRLSPTLWQGIALNLSRDPHPDSATFEKWVSVLLHSTYQPSHESHSDELEYLLKSCHHPQEIRASVLLFEHITRPRLYLKQQFKYAAKEPDRVDSEVAIQTSGYWLKDSWENLFRPNLTDFAESLEPIVTAHLQQAHRLIRSFGKGSNLWDPISLGRAAIEMHHQNSHNAAEGILIDAARDVLEYLLTHQPERGIHLIEKWSTSETPIMRRLAIHGITENSKLGYDEKVAWLLERGWLYGVEIKHEVFRLLKVTYPKLSNATRLRLLKEAEAGPKRQEDKEVSERIRQYQIYNLLFWLHKADPNCALAADHFEAIQRANPDFGPREHPDFDFWISTSTWGASSPITVEELLFNDPESAIDFLLCYQGEKLIEPDREGLLATVAGAVSRSFDWSWRLVQALQKENEPDLDSDIWASVLRGWEQSSLTEQQWDQILNLLITHRQLLRSDSEIAHLLTHGLTTEQVKLSSESTSLAENIVDQLWDRYDSVSALEAGATVDNWLDLAINHLGGQSTEIWLHILSKRRSEAGDAWINIPLEFKKRFVKILSGESLLAETGRVLLASQLHFLFALDPDWTQDNILPLLDWSVNEKRAQQAWHGYLVSGRWSQDLLPKMMPLYEKTFFRLKNGLSKELRYNFCGHLASIALFGTGSPLDDGWLWEFMKVVDEEDRISWASAMTRELALLKEDSAKELWNRWLNRYWSQRITGIPKPLSAKELEEMVYWSAELSPIFPEVVDKICKSKPPRLENTHLYHNLVAQKFAALHPTGLITLLLHLLPNAAQPFWQCSDVEELVRGLLDTPTPREGIKRICNELSRLGCPNAAQLAGSCEES